MTSVVPGKMAMNVEGGKRTLGSRIEGKGWANAGVRAPARVTQQQCFVVTWILLMP
jgi:hypothetical protein